MAYLAGERVALFTIIPLSSLKEPIWSVCVAILTCVLRIIYLAHDNTVWEQICVGVFHFLLLHMSLIDRRNTARNYSEKHHLQRYSETLKDIVENYLPEGILIILEKSKSIVFRNKAFLERLGTENSTLSDLDHLQFSPEDDVNENLKLKLSEILNNGNNSSSSKNTYISTKFSFENNSKKYQLKIVSTSWYDQDALVLIFHDITQQQLVLDLQASEKYKDHTIAEVSHELRTPLNGMLGMLQCLDLTEQSPQNKECIEICIHSGKFLLNLINSILDYDQIKNQKIKFNFEHLRLANLFDEIKHPMSILAQQKGIDFVLSINEDIPEIIYTDKNRLQQVITNLIGNAIKFTFHGYVTVRVGIDPQNSDMIEISVKDTGVGISQEKIKNLFQRYGKLEDTTGINKTGVGLGLIISQSLVKSLCYEKDSRGIRVSSVEGKGTTFSFSICYKSNKAEKKVVLKSECCEDVSNEPSNIKLPIFRNNKSNHIRLSKIQDKFKSSFNSKMKTTTLFQENKSSMNGLKKQDLSQILDLNEIILDSDILVVDDSPFNILVMTKMLKEFGLRASTAHHGLQCLELVKEKAKQDLFFSVIFMDCNMPVMDGYEAACELRKLMNEKEIPEIPIIALTANDSEEERRKCFEAGMHNFVSKPLSKQCLEQIIKEYNLSTGISNQITQ